MSDIEAFDAPHRIEARNKKGPDSSMKMVHSLLPHRLRSARRAEIVRTIFELAERGETASAIARALSEKGLERRNGKPWTQRRTAAILAREQFYKNGALRYGAVTSENRNFVLLGMDGTA